MTPKALQSSRDDLGEIRASLDGLLDGKGINIAYEAVDRHVAHGRGDRVALRWIAKSGSLTEISYRELSARTSQFANALAALGVGKGDRVFVLANRVPELHRRIARGHQAERSG